ncbi:hypothetical protein [Alkalihalobacillus pseudalcaliphilus]|uniref:hypothetical protein n=1 Tax=Alkalihalobacillus pseudalcaliphilus TaxID=79884 RepID=UPI00064DD5FE|nr:hypothetical protein [Alkalihalobacillus pseudalcaliphilus]KMK75402.1 hypothetical protein AB990_08770 [Alkalihalobacillus pseudalcaliphilus]
MTKQPLIITQRYGIKSDGARQFSVVERRTVDPTKSPKWAELIAATPDLDPSPRETWAEIGSYHATIASALKAIARHTTLTSEAETLAELIAELTDLADAIRIAGK